MGSTVSLSARALLAVALLVGFYLLSLALAAGLLALAYFGLTGVERGGWVVYHPKAGALCAVGALLLLASLLPRRTYSLVPGPKLDAADHPGLAAEIEKLAVDLGTEAPDAIYLTAHAGAAVYQVGGRLGFGGRRVLELGLPLLARLEVSELRGVFAGLASGEIPPPRWIAACERAGIADVDLSSLAPADAPPPAPAPRKREPLLKHGRKRDGETASGEPER